MENIKNIIEMAWNNNKMLKDSNTCDAISTIISKLDNGELRVAEPIFSKTSN